MALKGYRMSKTQLPIGTRSAVMAMGLLALAGCALAGCAQAGALGGYIAQAIPRHIDAAYKGLAGHRVLVLVWMDRGMRADYPNLRQDVAATLQEQLLLAQRTDDPEALHGATFPFEVAAVEKVLENHPEFESQPIERTAANFKGVDRILYLEVTQFATRPNPSADLFRGTMAGSVKAVEMTAAGDNAAADQVTVKVPFVENEIHVQYPKNSPKEGLPIGTDHQVGQGTVDAFVAEVAKRFYKHTEDRDG